MVGEKTVVRVSLEDGGGMEEAVDASFSINPSFAPRYPFVSVSNRLDIGSDRRSIIRFITTVVFCDRSFEYAIDSKTDRWISGRSIIRSEI